MVRNDIQHILISREQIARRLEELAGEITATYPNPDRGLTLVTILSGSMIFLSDLIRFLPMRMKIGLVTVSSYRGTAVSSGLPQVLRNLDIEITGEDVLVLDDILDTGKTLRLVTRELAALQPASLRTCVLLRKTAKAPTDLSVDFVGFDVEDVFVVGYGLDYNNYYRNYPHIGVLRPDVYKT